MSEGSGSIRLISRKDISHDKWDALVHQCDNSIFMSRWYLDEVMPDWKAYVLNDYEACLPVFITTKYTVKYALQPLFLRSMSVLGNKEKTKELVLVLKSKLSFFSIYMDISMDQFIDDQLVVRELSRYQILSLGQEYEAIYKKYSQNIKRNLRDFIKSGAEISEEKDVGVLIDMFRIEKGRQFSHLNDKAYIRLTNLMKSAQKLNSGILRAIRLDGEIVAMCFFIRQESKLLYLKGVVNKQGKEIGAMQALFDSVIKEYAAHFVSLDFGGSNNEGLALFNKKFGAFDRNYLILKHNATGWPLKSFINRKFGL